MDFGLSETQGLLRESIREFLRRHVPMERVRDVMEGERGHDPELLRSLADLGATEVLVGPEHEGAGLGLLDAVVLAQELGRGAVPLSFHSGWVMAPVLLAAGTAEQRRRWLPALARGEAVVSCAPEPLEARGSSLQGALNFVPDALEAQGIVVQVVEDGVASLHILPLSGDGVSVEALRTVDATRRVGEVRFDGMALGEDTRIPAADPVALLRRATDAGRTALAADALGAAQQVLEMAVAYAQERQQFGRPIGSFQAVKHMCAETVAEVEPVQSLLWYTAYAWDEELAESAHLVPLLKSHAAEVATRAVSTATEVYGGMGFTYECDVHIWFKRAAYDRQMLGGPAELRRQAMAAQFPQDALSLQP